MEMKQGNLFRTLRADEIECRVGTQSAKGLTLLLYKDARCDMNLLDEVFTPFGWQRKHEIIDGKLYCTVSVRDFDANGNTVWISKQDVGTESNTEKEKGEASDSFKRACVNLGAGRELYTAPFIWVPNDKYKTSTNPKTGKEVCQDKFSVTGIEYDDRRNISKLRIVNDRTHEVVFSTGYGKDAWKKPEAEKTPEPAEKITTPFSLDNPHLECADCKSAIYAVSNKDGSAMSLSDYEAQCKKYYGKILCKECRLKLVKESK